MNLKPKPDPKPNPKPNPSPNPGKPMGSSFCSTCASSSCSMSDSFRMRSSRLRTRRAATHDENGQATTSAASAVASLGITDGAIIHATLFSPLSSRRRRGAPLDGRGAPLDGRSAPLDGRSAPLDGAAILDAIQTASLGRASGDVTHVSAHACRLPRGGAAALRSHPCSARAYAARTISSVQSAELAGMGTEQQRFEFTVRVRRPPPPVFHPYSVMS